MKKILLLIPLFSLSKITFTMEKPIRLISIREDLDFENPRKISSLFDAVIGGKCSTDLKKETLSFPDYKDRKIVYIMPFDKVHMAIMLLSQEKRRTTFNDQYHSIFERYMAESRQNNLPPTRKKRDEKKAALLSLFTNISEEEVVEVCTPAIINFITLEDLDQQSLTPNDLKRDIESIKKNRMALLDAAQKENIERFTECLQKPLTKKPWPGIAIEIDKCIKRIHKNGDDIIDRPENSDDDGLGDD